MTNGRSSGMDEQATIVVGGDGARLREILTKCPSA
jgi:hypothetical protein